MVGGTLSCVVITILVDIQQGFSSFSRWIFISRRNKCVSRRHFQKADFFLSFFILVENLITHDTRNFAANKLKPSQSLVVIFTCKREDGRRAEINNLPSAKWMNWWKFCSAKFALIRLAWSCSTTEWSARFQPLNRFEIDMVTSVSIICVKSGIFSPYGLLI